MPLISPREHYAEFAAGDVAVFMADKASRRLAMNAAAALNDFAEWTYKFCKKERPDIIQSADGGLLTFSEFRAAATAQCRSVGVVRDLADGKHHRFVERSSSFFTSATSASLPSEGYWVFEPTGSPIHHEVVATAQFWLAWMADRNV